jgi:hypothetical protein
VKRFNGVLDILGAAVVWSSLISGLVLFYGGR